MKKINIGPTKASDYFGAHVIPANTQFLRLSNYENAFSLAKALWDTTGWLWSDRYPGVDRRKARAEDVKAFDNDLFKRCPDLQLLRDLADAAKHGGELSNPNVTVTGLSGSGSPGGTIFTTTMFGTPIDITLSELAIEAFLPADAETARIVLAEGSKG